MSLVQDRFDLDFTEIKMDGQSYYIKRQSSETLNNSVDKITDVTNEIDYSWVNLKKVLDKHPKKAIQFFHDKDGWQLKICATLL